jgi:hypothetical protein
LFISDSAVRLIAIKYDEEAGIQKLPVLKIGGEFEIASFKIPSFKKTKQAGNLKILLELKKVINQSTCLHTSQPSSHVTSQGAKLSRIKLIYILIGSIIFQFAIIQ